MASAQAQMRRGVAMIGAGLGLVVASPMFYIVGERWRWLR
jgi:hypothetical protein